MTLPTDPRDGQAHIPQQQSSAPPDAPATEAPTRTPRRPRWPLIAAAVVVVLAVVGGVVYALMPGEEDKAVDRCQAAVTDKLTSPSTAKYGDPAVSREEGNFGSYFEVSGPVDSQNGFGAMVRSEYRCKVTLEKDGRWVVTESTVTTG